MSQQTVKPGCTKGCRRPASQIDRIEFFLFGNICNIGELPAERIQVIVHPIKILRNRVRSKGTICTGCRTERDSDIETVSILVIQSGQQLLFPFCNCQSQFRLLFRDKVLLFNPVQNLLIRHSFF